MLWLVEHGAKEGSLKGYSRSQIAELAEEREKGDNCYTAWHDSEIIACGGMDLLWEGVGQVWIIMPEKTRHAKSLFRLFKNKLDYLTKKNNLWRVQAYARIGLDESHTLLRHLGFETEGIMRKYTPDKADCILYAKVK
jgi:hypothetical protein